MKKVLTLLATCLLSLQIIAQAPQRLSYQAIIRNTSNALVTSAPVSMRISILPGSLTATPIYTELHNTTTNASGVAFIEIGGGTSPTGVFSNINWGSGTYFLRSETDPAGGTNYTIVGTTQLLSVPFALYANNGLPASGSHGPVQLYRCNGTIQYTPCTAILTTTAASGITHQTANSGGNITNDGGAPVTARGVVWSTAVNPTIALTTKTTDGSGNGTFTSAITNLLPNTLYYVRAYATNSAGTAYGNQLSFTTTPPPATLTALNCTGATNNGTLTAGSAASGVSSIVPYTGGNAGIYPAQSIPSTGVAGLTANLSAGAVASGSGSLTYTISGTPSSSGTASFALSIGGINCILTRTVAAAYRAGTIHCGPTATSVVEVINPTTGRTWMDRNLGASRVATSSNDANAYGDLYQWGRGSDGHQCRSSTTTTVLSSTDQPGNRNFILAPATPFDWRSPQNLTLWQGVNGINNPCPIGYRIPTTSELTDEYISWSSANAAGAYNSILKWVMAGWRSGLNGSLNDAGLFGEYWSSTSGSYIGFDIFSVGNYDGTSPAVGKSVRCIKDLQAATITALNCTLAANTGILTSGIAASGVSSSVPYTGGNGGAYSARSILSTGITGLTASIRGGVVANGNGSFNFTIKGTPSGAGTANFSLNIGGRICTLSLIVYPQYASGTVHCGGIPTQLVPVTSPSGRVWMDRNLGARNAALTNDDFNAKGDLYQWGRRADGHQCRTSSTTTTLSSTDQPDHGNFIISSTTPNDWRSTQNNSLWQGLSGINNPCPQGYRLPTEAEWNAEIPFWEGLGSVALSSVLKLPAGGGRGAVDGIITDALAGAQYHSSTIIGTGSRALVWTISSAGSAVSFNNGGRASGLSVRCIRN